MYIVTGITRGNIIIHEEIDEKNIAEEKFFEACFKCDRVTLYSKIENRNIMNF